MTESCNSLPLSASIAASASAAERGSVTKKHVPPRLAFSLQPKHHPQSECPHTCCLLHIYSTCFRAHCMCDPQDHTSKHFLQRYRTYSFSPSLGEAFSTSPASPPGHVAMVPALSNANHSQLHMYSSFTAGNDLRLLNTFSLGNQSKRNRDSYEFASTFASPCLSVPVCGLSV
jgi:hypothetical protein